MDIVIYMNPEDFGHKTSLPVIDAFWEMKRYPKHFTVEDKIYIAAKGRVQGYAECDEFNPDGSVETLMWNSGTWMQFVNEKIPCKPFRGFRYKWWTEEEEKKSF
ncbi:hypothetical protein LCGC14_0460800 [marine sediment metagenome]|uniref:Uncharacterized protein n=1 Tax=marine sediment metagenome TaxID=412755 RepID=A0A0F9VNW9_9ZZZZ|nr:hypothetical protein [bacterium]